MAPSTQELRDAFRRSGHWHGHPLRRQRGQEARRARRSPDADTGSPDLTQNNRRTK